MVNNKLWSLEQLKALRSFDYEPIAGVKVCLIPISKGGRGQGYGSTVVWDKRIYRQGVMGPRELTASELEGAGVPKEEAEKIEAEATKALGMLRELYPVLLPRVEKLREAIEASVKAIGVKAESLRGD
ncbi:unnamed protein product [marine sediment metagenome]|uniref:Uncharacterized protein n=1 Tax=marine sediment metagenome TaxID=412755 RepID=X1RSZ4_9ZZZZ